MENNTIGYLICETASTEPTNPNILRVTNDRVTIETCLQDMNVKNRNGRFYEDKELVPQLKSPRLLELMQTRNFFGECGHPTSNDISRQQTIDPTNMSHRIDKLWVDNIKVMGHVTAASTRVGDDFNRLVLSGTKVSFSLRALGTVKSTSRGAEVKNIRIITYDMVIFPSHAAAYMNKIINVSESALIGESNNLLLTENDKGLIVPITNNSVASYIKDSSKNVKKVIESFEFLYDTITLNEHGNMINLKDREGNILVVHLESHIQNEIMNHCYDKYKRKG